MPFQKLFQNHRQFIIMIMNAHDTGSIKQFILLVQLVSILNLFALGPFCIEWPYFSKNIGFIAPSAKLPGVTNPWSSFARNVLQGSVLFKYTVVSRAAFFTYHKHIRYGDPFQTLLQGSILHQDATEHRIYKNSILPFEYFTPKFLAAATFRFWV